MSNSYLQDPVGAPEYQSEDSAGTMHAVKREATELKDSTATQVGHVADTAKSEAAEVVNEAKTQVKDLYATTQRELKEQAGLQQERVASGLRSIGEELGSMAAQAQQPSVASDLVRQASERMGRAASWLDARDPGSLLSEVTGYARRNPGTFIAVAAVAGAVAGRLTRALATNAADQKDTSASSSTNVQPSGSAAPSSSPTVVNPLGTSEATPRFDDTPLYTQESHVHGEDVLGQEGRL
ncbi:hypothetical protein VLI63_09310 [Lacisediminihabitans sp. H27-G8]